MGNTQHRAEQAALFALLLGADQLTKHFATALLRGQGPAVLIPGVLEFSYLENTGAAFNIFFGMNTLMLLVSSLLVVAVCFVFFRIPATRRWRPLQYALVPLVAGALGNIIDRAMRGFVVDFIYFVPIHFPKFNLADSYIVVAIVLLFVLIAFRYKEEELGQMLKSGRKAA